MERTTRGKKMKKTFTKKDNDSKGGSREERRSSKPSVRSDKPRKREERPAERSRKKEAGDSRGTSERKTFSKSPARVDKYKRHEEQHSDRPKKRESRDDDNRGNREEKRFSKSPTRVDKYIRTEERNSDHTRKNESRDNDSRGNREEKRFSKPASKFGKSKFSSDRKTDSSWENASGEIRLNKYIANSGICSRREADELIANGVVSVNGKIVTELGTKVSSSDVIQFGGETLRKEKLMYLLLNKPKDYITTTDDPEGRKTVMMLIQNACKERIYPVGRLDRATTGLLLFTNDGELAKKLMHPRFGVKKMYHVELDKNLTKADMDKIASGIELDDGFAEVDVIAYDNHDPGNKKSIGLELHSGKNRIVRRIFEALDYKVVKLDRVFFCWIDKKRFAKRQMEVLDPNGD
jgi:23S rRNA pseudouridine2605 synthase